MTSPAIDLELAECRAGFERARDLAQWSEAQRYLERWLTRQPENAAVWSDLGVVLRVRKKFREALACYRKSLELNRSTIPTWSNLGNVLKDLGRFEEAIAAHERVLASTPTDATAWHNLAIVFNQARRFDEALNALDRALALTSDKDLMLFERALILLRQGHLLEGWRDYESRWVKTPPRWRTLPYPFWDGTPRNGAIYVHSEQGLGDCVLAARFLPLAKSRGVRILLECRRELRRLFTNLPGVDALLEEGEVPTDAVAHCPLMSLPLILGITPSQVPPPSRLHVPESSRQMASQLLPRNSARFRIGIIWSGNVGFAENHWRACTVDRFLRFMDVPGVDLYSLQKGPARAELTQLATSVLIPDLADHLSDFADTAAVLERLDLLVMTDSAAAHVAGSLGIRVWNLLQYVPYWIYDIGNEKTAWYPTMTLFRQERWGNWDDVFENATTALQRLRGT
jgi:hypothetical protein